MSYHNVYNIISNGSGEKCDSVHTNEGERERQREKMNVSACHEERDPANTAKCQQLLNPHRGLANFFCKSQRVNMALWPVVVSVQMTRLCFAARQYVVNESVHPAMPFITNAGPGLDWAQGCRPQALPQVNDHASPGHSSDFSVHLKIFKKRFWKKKGFQYVEIHSTT